MFAGYWGEEELTNHTLREGWHHTGDIGRLDEEGFLWFVGRKADDGLFLLHTIGKELSTTTTADPFMTKYLFPGGNMPSIAQIGAAVEKSFVMEDWHLIGPDDFNYLYLYDFKFRIAVRITSYKRHFTLAKPLRRSPQSRYR